MSVVTLGTKSQRVHSPKVTMEESGSLAGGYFINRNRMRSTCRGHELAIG